MDGPLFELLYQCTVRITVPNGVGTGFFVAPGLVLSNAHVVERHQDKPSQIKIDYNGQKYSVTIEHYLRRPYPDLVLLGVEVEQHPCVLLEEIVESGHELYVYGYTSEYKGGEAARVTYEGPARYDDQRWLLKFKAGQIIPGYSGAPLLNTTLWSVSGVVKSTRDRSSDLGGRGIPSRVILSELTHLVDLQEQFHQQDGRWAEARRRQIEFGLVGTELDPAWLGWHLRAVEEAFARQMGDDQAIPAEEASRLYAHLSLTKNKKDPDGVRLDYPPSTLLARDGATILILGEGGAGKTTLLHKLAADAAALARASRTAPVPFYFPLNRFATKNGEVNRLLQMFSGVWKIKQELLEKLWQEGKRPLLFLLDGFNEVDPAYQKACLEALREFMQGEPHRYVITSRPFELAERLIAQVGDMERMEVVPLNREQIRSYLESRDAGPLYDQMGDRLRELAENPFMLWALTQTYREAPQRELPANIGQLFQSFVDDFIFSRREQKKEPPPTEYNYLLVKQPILAEMAMRATQKGQTKWPEDNQLLDHIGNWLEALETANEHRRSLKPYKFMPEKYAATDLLDESVANGVLLRDEEQFAFMHQTVGDYFTATGLSGLPLDKVVAKVEEARWQLKGDGLVNERRSPFYDAIVMLSGIFEDSSDLILKLVGRDPLLAASAFRASAKASPIAAQALKDNSLRQLGSDDRRDRLLAVFSLGDARIFDSEVADRLLEVINDDEYELVRANALLVLSRILEEPSLLLFFEIAVNNSDKITRVTAAQLMATLPPVCHDPLMQWTLFALSLARGVEKLDAMERFDLVRTSGMALGMLNKKINLDDLVVIAFGEDANRQEAAIMSLRLTDPAGGVRALAALIDDENITSAAKTRAFYALRLLPVAGTTQPTLEKILTNAKIDDALRTQAAMALGVLAYQNFLATGDIVENVSQVDEFDSGDAKAVLELLRRILLDRQESPRVRTGAMVALVWTDQGTDLETIVARLKDEAEPAEFRALAATAISQALRPPLPSWLTAFSATLSLEQNFITDASKRRVAMTSGLLLELALEDEIKDVRTGATYGLKRYQGVEEALFQKLLDETEETEIRYAAATALYRIGGKLIERRLQESVSKVQNDMVRAAIMFALEQLWGGPDVARLLAGYEALSDDELGAIVRALYFMKEEEITELLMTLILDPGQDEGLRQAAAIGMVLSGLDPARSSLLEVLRGPDRYAAGLAIFAFTLWQASEAPDYVAPQDSRRVAMLVIAHYQAGNYDHALALSNEAIEQSPGEADLYLARGTIHFETQQLEEALADLKLAEELAPDRADVHNLQGGVYYGLGRRDEALAAYRRALALDENLAAAQLGLGNVYFAQQGFEEAIDAYQRATQGEAQAAYAYNRLGNTHFHLGRNQEALSAFRQATELNPNFAYPYYGLGNVFAFLEQSEDAQQSYQRAIELDANFSHAHVGLGDHLLQIGHNEEALAAFENALKIEPDLAAAHIGIIAALSRLGREAQAAEHIQLIEEALENLVDYKEYYQARFAAVTGDTDAALKHVEQALEKRQVRPEWTWKDAGFEALKNDPRFAELVGFV